MDVFKNATATGAFFLSKGNKKIYIVVCIAMHTETQQYLVIYAPQENPNTYFAMPYERFFDGRFEEVQ